MVEERRVPEVCLLQCPPTRLHETITGAMSAHFHVDFLLPIHNDYGKWLFHLVKIQPHQYMKLKTERQDCQCMFYEATCKRFSWKVFSWLQSLYLLQMVGINILCVHLLHCVLWNSLMHGYSPCAHLWICRNHINTFTVKVDLGRFKYVRFKLPASTLLDLTFALLP
jgi:hypothetical protein